jgi:hypothetical protein
MTVSSLRRNLAAAWCLHSFLGLLLLAAAHLLAVFYDAAPPHPPAALQAYFDLISAPPVLLLMKVLGLLLFAGGFLIGAGTPGALRFLTALNLGTHYLGLLFAAVSGLLIFYHGLGVLLFFSFAILLLFLRLSRDRLIAARRLAEERGLIPGYLYLSLCSAALLAAACAFEFYLFPR